MKFAWRRNTVDLAAWNSAKVEEVSLDEYSELLDNEDQAAEWNNQLSQDDVPVVENILDD